MHGLRLENPQWLWLAVVLAPLLIVFAVRSMAVGRLRQSMTLGVIRLLALLCVAIALARPVILAAAPEQPRPRAVILRDRSGSVAADQATADRFERQLSAALEGRASVDRFDFAGRLLHGTKPLDTRATDIEAALDEANGGTLDAPGCHIILLSDARSTRGDAPAAAARVASRGAVVSVMPLGIHQPNPPHMTDIEPPIMPRRETTTAMRVTIATDQPVTALVLLRDPQGQIVAQRQLPLDSQATVLLSFDAAEGGVKNYTVELRTSPRASENPAAVAASPPSDQRSVPIFVQEPPRILLADRRTDEVTGLAHALETLRLPVDVRSPSDWPPDLTPYAAIVISDFAGQELTSAQVQAVRSYVEDDGGLLVFIGGANVSAAQWKLNPLAEALPVVLKDRPPKPVVKPPDVSVCFVIDRSGSMNQMLKSNVGPQRSKIELVKTSIRKSLEKLPLGSHVAVVAFNSAAEVIVPARSIDREADRADISQAVDNINVWDGTTMSAGLEQGLGLLEGMPGKRFLVVLTDGESSEAADFDWGALAGRAVKDGISWTSIGVGSDITDQARYVLRDLLAGGAHGVYHYCGTADQVPQVFIEQMAKIQKTVELKPDPFRAAPGPQAGELHGPPVDSMPPLTGMVLSTPRPGAQVMLLGEKGAPLLARWQVKLGHVVAFTSDAKNNWAAQWTSWDRWAMFWGAATGGILRPPQDVIAQVRRHQSGRDVQFVFEIHDSHDRPLDGLIGKNAALAAPGVSVPLPAADAPPVNWRQTSAGEYVGTVSLPPGLSQMTNLLSLTRTGHPPIQYCASVSAPADPEMAHTGPDFEMARQIATAGGGIVSTDPAAIAAILAPASIKGRPDRVQDVWQYVVMALICLWPIDLAARKLLS